MQVHEASGIFLDLAGVHEAPRKIHAILDVGRAAPPLPALLLVLVALLLTVTATLAQVALAASCRHGVGDSGRGDGICEGSLPAA